MTPTRTRGPPRWPAPAARRHASSPSREVVATPAAKAALCASHRRGGGGHGVRRSSWPPRGAAGCADRWSCAASPTPRSDRVPAELTALVTPEGQLRARARAGRWRVTQPAACCRAPLALRRGHAGARSTAVGAGARGASRPHREPMRRRSSPGAPASWGPTSCASSSRTATGARARAPGRRPPRARGLRGGDRRGRSARCRRPSARAVAGVRHVYHVAADYRLWAPDLAGALPRQRRRHPARAGRGGARRARSASSTPPRWARSASPRTAPRATRRRRCPSPTWSGAYKASKFLAERVAREIAARGAPVVIVNPSAPIGPWDVKPTPTGQMIVDFLRGKMIGSLDTGLNIVHVRDVARGHILAAETRPGRRALHPGPPRTSRCSRSSSALAASPGCRAPRFRVPYAVAWMAAAGDGGRGPR